jgi:Ca2+-transporting ATPase
MPGLTTREAVDRLSTCGPNALPQPPPSPWWHRLAGQFASPLIAILAAALAFDLGFWLYEGAAGLPIEAIAIALILVLNAALGLAQEWRSEAALARLASLAAAQSWALRDGELCRVPSAELVPGDRVWLQGGDRVPADGMLAEARGVQADESLLTGESLPVDKGEGDEVFSGTLLVRGASFLDVARTGATSAMGRLAAMLGGVRPTPTPLERRVDRLGRQIAAGVAVLALLLAAGGVLAEGWSRAPGMILFAVAIAVAAVPEGLPAVITIALALGVERMARRRAVVRRLAAVEALGSVTVIATDKTGTLTENRMEVRTLDSPTPERAWRAMALANETEPGTAAGDPLELGLLRFAERAGVDVARLRRECPRLSGRPFDSEWKFMRVTVEEADGPHSYLKGAPEVLIARSELDAAERASWSEKASAYALEGFRVLALGTAPGGREEQLEFLGLVLFWDPPRAEVAAAVHLAHAAGIRVVMITGDHPATALAVAHQIGLVGGRVLTGEDLDDFHGGALESALAEVDVFARVRPEQKLRLVEALQARGEVVAMTGDGINDAPALKRADVGVAMGQRGSDVSREVADLVLLDDNFATIVHAVEEGRSIYENIQKFLRFLGSTNFSELAVLAGGTALAFALDLRDGAGVLLLPLTAAQILWINLVTDCLPAAALSLDRTPDVMRRRPRPAEAPLLDRASLRFVAAAGIGKALLALALLGLVPRLGHDAAAARTVVFHMMAVGQLLLAYPSHRTVRGTPGNRYLHAAVAIGLLVQAAVATVPAAGELLGTVAIPAPLWGLVAGAAIAAWLLAEGAARFAGGPARQTGVAA